MLSAQKHLLSESECKSLDSLGYVSLGRLLDDVQLEAIRERVRQLVEEEGDQGGHELFSSDRIRHPKEEGADRLANLVDLERDREFVGDDVGHRGRRNRIGWQHRRESGGERPHLCDSPRVVLDRLSERSDRLLYHGH